MQRWCYGLSAIFFYAMVWAEAKTEVAPVEASKLVSAAPTMPVYRDAKKPILLKPGQTEFKIILPANPTTGYAWFTKDFSHSIVQLEKQIFIPPDEQIPGRGGEEEWDFSVDPDAFKARYVGFIKLLYAQPWEMKKGTVTEFTVITVPKEEAAAGD